MSNEYNHPHTTITCPECKQNDTLYDSRHDETYCTVCGTVIIDNTIISIPRILDWEREKELYIRDLWKKKKK